MTLTFSTHCSGGELAGVGFRQAGARHVDGFEIDAKIAAVATRNGFNVHAMDVCAVDYAVLAPVDHWHSSPSCKRASRANVNAGETADDLAVAESVCRLIRVHRGRTFTLENVIEYRWFESYDRICQALKECGFLFRVTPKGGDTPSWRSSVPVWNDAGEFVDAADFGVPQNRKRLILRAARGVDRLPGLRPTHSKRGGVLLDRWNGWYSAVADLLHTMPDTTPAPWQLKRMPKELRESMLIEKHGASAHRDLVTRFADEPAWTVRASGRQEEAAIAFLLDGENGGGEWGRHYRDADEPVFTISGAQKGAHRAYIVAGGNTQLSQVDSHARADDQPAMTIRSSRMPTHRAYAGGVWKKIDIRGLARFQSVPDDYLGLTPEINGNGIPSLMARRILESLRGVYES